LDLTRQAKRWNTLSHSPAAALVAGTSFLLSSLALRDRCPHTPDLHIHRPAKRLCAFLPADMTTHIAYHRAAFNQKNNILM